MTVYYKATRPDGTDFRTGTVDYAAALVSGQTLVHPEQTLIADEAQTYFSVSTEPGETLIGGGWPCRLFRVEIDKDAERSQVHRHKACTRTVRVVEELPAWQALGPNGKAVAAFIEGAAAGDAAWDAAWAAAGDAARDAAWAAARAAARDAARAAARDAARDAARAAAWDAARAAAWDAARAAAGAVLAIVTRDLISPEKFNALMRPWRILTGEDV